MKYQKPELISFNPQENAQGLCIVGTGASFAGAPCYCTAGTGVTGLPGPFCNGGNADTASFDCSAGGAVGTGFTSCTTGTLPV